MFTVKCLKLANVNFDKQATAMLYSAMKTKFVPHFKTQTVKYERMFKNKEKLKLQKKVQMKEVAKRFTVQKHTFSFMFFIQQDMKYSLRQEE